MREKPSRYSVRDLQARCAAFGFDPGPIDNLWGVRTQQAVRAAMEARGVDSADALFHPSGLHRVIMHWTAGAYPVLKDELAHYHILIDKDGRAWPGLLKPESNADVSDGSYVAHTRALNTGSIGVAVDAMAGAHEVPFDAGSAPITEAQVDALAREVADLCMTYDIPVSKWTVLSHAEVQPTLGVWQRGKWDIKWIPGMDRPGDPVAVGDELRRRILAEVH